MGSAFGTARSGTGIAAAAVMRPEGIMKSILPVVMAGVLYFRRKCDSFNIIIARYHRHLRSGCCCPHRRAADPTWLHAVPVDKKWPRLHVPQVYILQGLHPSRRRSLCRPLRPGCRLRGGGGLVGDSGVRATAQQSRFFVGQMLILIFSEVVGLFGLIVSIYLYGKK